MTRTELIKQAIESAKCRIYKLDFDLEGKLSAHHQKKAENQKELMKITVEALEKQIPKKPIENDTSYSGYKCPTCNSNIYQLRSHNIMQTPQCIFCGQALKWGEEDD